MIDIIAFSTKRDYVVKELTCVHSFILKKNPFVREVMLGLRLTTVLGGKMAHA